VAVAAVMRPSHRAARVTAALAAAPRSPLREIHNIAHWQHLTPILLFIIAEHTQIVFN